MTLQNLSALSDRSAGTSAPAAAPANTSSSDPLLRALSSPLLLTLLVLLGIALRVWAYAGNTALYLDEILLSHSILNIPMKELLSQPLPLDQVAPLGFLFVERLCVTIFGHNEIALRLFPFLAALASVFLFRRLAERMLTGAAPAFALFVFAIGFPFIRYAATVKQYELDATAAILLSLLAVEVRARATSTRKLLLLGLVGFAVVWFSQASVLVMAGIGLAFAIEWLLSRNRESSRALLFAVPLWAAASLAAVFVGLRSMTPSTREFMNNFWAGGFAPRPFKFGPTLKWLWDSLKQLFSDSTLLRYRWPVVFLLVAFVGILALWRRNRPTALLLLGPFTLAVLAGLTGQYPFRGRLAFWLLPAVILVLAAGAEWLRFQLARGHYLVATAGLLALLVPPVMAFAQAPPPYELEHPRELLGYLQQHRRPGDVIYVFPLATVGTRFYGPQSGLSRQDWIASVCDRYDVRAYLRDIDRFRGVPRFWIISGGSPAYRSVRVSTQQYLAAIGKKVDSLSLFSATYGSVTVELYDLSDPARLSLASADSFPVLPMSTDPRPGCRPWIYHWPGESE